MLAGSSFVVCVMRDPGYVYPPVLEEEEEEDINSGNESTSLSVALLRRENASIISGKWCDEVIYFLFSDYKSHSLIHSFLHSAKYTHHLGQFIVPDVLVVFLKEVRILVAFMLS
jgi:hypothetical protein